MSITIDENGVTIHLDFDTLQTIAEIGIEFLTDEKVEKALAEFAAKIAE